MADEYRIPISFGDFNNTLKDLYQDYEKTKVIIEKNMIKLRLGSDANDLKKVEAQIKSLENKPGEIILGLDTGTLDKQFQALPKYASKNAKDVGKEFRENVLEGFSGRELSIRDLIPNLTNKKNLSKGAVKEVISQLSDSITSPVSKDNYIEILKQAEAMEQLLAVIKELKGIKGYESLVSDMGIKESDLQNNIAKQYTNIGKVLSNGDYTQTFLNQITDAFNLLSKNLDAFYQSLSNTIKELGTGLTGNGTGNGTGGGVNKELEEINQQIDETINKVEEAKKKLQELKEQSRGSDIGAQLKKEYKEYMDDVLSDSYHPTKQEETAREKKLYAMMELYKKSGGKLTADMKDSYSEFKQTYKQPDMSLVNIPTIDENLIKQQEELIAGLENKLQELQEKKKKIIEESKSGTGTGNGGDQEVPKVDIDIEEAKQKIAEIKEEISSIEDKTIKITIDGPDAKSLDLLNKMQDIYERINDEKYREYGVAFNSKTGETSSIVKSENTSRPSIKTGSAVKEMNGKADSILHTHPNSSFAAFSVGDFDSVIDDFKNGIKYQLVEATNQIASIDISKMVDQEVDFGKLQQAMRTRYKEEEQLYMAENQDKYTFKGILSHVGEYEQTLSNGIQTAIDNIFSSNNIVGTDATNSVSKELINTIINQIRLLSSSNDIAGTTGIMTDEIENAINSYVDNILAIMKSSDPQIGNEIGEAISQAIESIIPKEISDGLTIDKNTAEMIRQRAFPKALKDVGVEPSDVYKLQGRNEWLQSLYPMDFKPEPIHVQINVDVNQNPSRGIELTTNEFRDIQTTPNEPTSGNMGDQIADGANTATEAVDNLGRKIDETFAKKISGTALVDDMQRIITLFHYSDKEFDAFDLSKSQTNTRLGRGAYFGFTDTNMADFLGQDIMSQWYANVSNIFDTTKGNETQLDASQIENFITTYLSSESEDYISNFRQSLQKGGLDAIRAIKAEANKSNDIEMFKNMMGSLGYDAILGETSGPYGGIQQTLKELNVLDPSKIFKIDNSQFSELDKINSQIEEARMVIQGYKNDIEEFTAAAQDITKTQEDRNYFQEMIDSGFKDENEQIRIWEEKLQQLLDMKQKLSEAIITQVSPSNENQILSGVTAIPEQEEAAGQAGQQMGKEISNGAELAKQRVRELLNSVMELEDQIKSPDPRGQGLARYFYDIDQSYGTGEVTDIREEIERYKKYKKAYNKGIQITEQGAMGTEHFIPTEDDLQAMKLRIASMMKSLKDEGIGYTSYLSSSEQKEFVPMYKQISEAVEQWRSELTTIEEKNDAIRANIDGIKQELIDTLSVFGEIDISKIDSLLSVINKRSIEENGMEKYVNKALNIPQKSLNQTTSSSSSEAEESAEADNRAADAAITRAEANERLAESEQHVAQSESSTTGTTQQDSGANTSKFSEERAAVEEAVLAEQQAFDRLISKLTSEVPNAVDTKTDAFRSEQVEVDNLIDLEISKLEELAIALQDVFKGVGKNPDFGGLKDLLETLNQLRTEENSIPDFAKLNEVIEKLVEAVRKLEGLSSVSGNISELINSFKITKANIDNIVDLSAAIEMLAEVLSKLDGNTGSSPFMSNINDLLKNAEALKDLAKILNATQKDFDRAKKESANMGANRVDDVDQAWDEAYQEYDTRNIKEASSAYDELIKHAREYYDLKAKVDSDGIYSLSDKERSNYQSWSDMFTKAESAAEKYKNTSQELIDKQKELNKYMEEYGKISQKNNSQDNFDKYKKETEKAINMSGLQKTYDRLLSESGNRPEAFTGKLTLIEEKLKELNGYLPIDHVFSDEERGRVEELRNDIARLEKEVQTSPEYKSAKEVAVSNLRAQVQQWGANNSAALRDADFKATFDEITTGLSNVNTLSEQMVLADKFNELKASAAEAGKTGLSFFDGWKNRLKSLMQYLGSFASFYRIIGVFKQAVNIVKELDTALMEVRKVSTESLSSLEQWQKLTFDQADEVGGSAIQLEKSTAAWLRLGKSFSEAQEAAQASVKLLNVSEFTSIDDATTSLVSMRQAFDDLSYDDFIDKLNGVGDHFSSSTDQLAQGMKNVSSVLKVAGNDIDQSLALLTAANDITQDMSKASMGVRTVALRISGTQEAKQELEDLGEDVSDFVVQTQSKVDAQVRAYTKTAKTPNGISVLDETGRLRSTYDILVDISQVYDEIVKKDNEYGTNTSNALLELLAGKTRSNILASILQNPQLLQDAFEQSKNSQGIGQRELDIYLDSVEAKLARLQNRLQELAAVTIDSGWLKALIDLGTGAIKIITELGKQFGVLNTVIGGIAGFALQKSGKGILATSKGAGWNALLNNYFDKRSAKTAIENSIVKPLEGNIATAWKNLNLNLDENFFDQMQAKGGYTVSTLQQSEIFGPVLSGLSETEIKAKTANDVLTDMTTTLKIMPQQAKGLSSIGDKIGSILSATLTSLAISAAINLAIKGLGWFWTNVVKYEETAIKKGEEAKKNIQDINDALTNKKNFVSESGDRLIELHAGVDEETGKNVKLTNEEYEEYLSLANEIAGIYPSIVKSYDEQGNAVLDLSKNITEAKQSLQEFLDTEKIVAGMQIASNLDSIIEEGRIKTKNKRADIATATAELQDYEQSGNYYNGNLSLENVKKNGIYYRSHEEYNVIAEALRNLGIQFSSEGVDNTLGEGGGRINIPLIFNPEINESQIQSINEVLKSNGFITGGNYQQKSAKKQAEITAYETQIQEIWNEIIPSIIGSFEANPNYGLLSDELKNGLNAVLSNVDFENIEKPSDKTWAEFFEETYLNPIINGINSADPIKVNAAFNSLLKDGITTGRKDNELKDYVNSMLEELFDGDEFTEFRKTIKIALGFTVVDEDGNEHWNTDILNEQLFDRFGISQDENGEWVNKGKVSNRMIENLLTIDEKEALKEGLDLGKINIDPYTVSLYELIEAVHKYQEEAKQIPEIEKDTTLSSLFSDETYKDSAEGYEKHLSSLTGALEKIRTEGELTNEEIGDLIEEFPNLFKSFDDVNEETIGVAAFEELNKWITLIRDNIDDTWTDDAIKAAETYIQTLQMQFGDFGVTADQVRDKIKEMIINPAEGSEASIARANTLTKAFEEAGLEENPEIVASFIADPSNLEGTTSDIISRFQDFVLNWHIYMDKKEVDAEVAKIERGVADRNARRGALDQARAYSEETGRSLGAIANDANANITKKKTLWERAKKENGVTSKEAKDALEELDNAYIEMYAAVSNMDFGEEIAIDQANVDAKRAEFGKQYEYYFNNLQNWADDDPQKSVAYQAMETARQEYFSALITQQQTFDTKDQENIRGYTDAINDSQTEVTKLQDEIEKANNSGKRVSRETYDALSQEYSEQAEQQRGLAEYWDGVANDATRSIADQKAARKNAAEALAEATSLDKQAQETSRQFDTDTLTEYQNKYADMQTEATQLEEGITQAEAKHQKVSAKMYQNLIDNGRKQVDNLKDQKDTLQTLQKQVARNSTEWRDYQSQIDSIDSSISSMQNNQLGWFETMTSLVSTNASELASTLSSAFSEINSETGLTIDTMNELERQFSDLAGYDVDNIFYQSADGMKLNTRAAEELVDAEYELQTNNLYAEIERQNQIIEQQSKLHGEDAEAAVAAANKRIEAANRELSMLQALYDQQKENFELYTKFQNAQQTENAGAHYEGMQGYLKTQIENREKGLTGTDEFRAYTEYFDRWGLDTIGAWDRNKEKIQRYLTEDSSGMGNFLDDLVEKGFATKDGTFYSMDISSVEDAAAAMGMSVEWFRDMIGRLEDYGYYDDWVESELDGREKIQESINKQVEAQLEYNKIMREGGNAEVLEEAQGEIDRQSDRISNLRENIQDVIADEGMISAQEIRNAVEDINAINELKKQATSTEEIEAYNELIQGYADSHYIKLTPEFEVDTGYLDKQFEGWDGEVTVKVKPVLPNGIDLLNRPQVSAEDMWANGWEEVQEGTNATVFTSTYTNRDFDLEGPTRAVVVTPILPNGDVIDSDGLEGYAKQLLSGEEIDAAVELKMFEGEDAKEQADRYAEALHQLQAMYTPEEGWSDEIADTVELISGYSGENLDKIVFGDHEYQNEPLEKALDGLLDKFGLGQEYGKALIEVIKQMFELTPDESDNKYEVPTVAPEAGQSTTQSYESMVRQYDQGIEQSVHKQEIIEVVYELSSQGYTPQQIEEMAQDETKDIGVEISGEEDIQTLQEALNDISKGADLVVKLDQSSIDALTTTNTTVDVDTDEASSRVEQLEKKMQGLNDVEDPHIGADTHDATVKIAQVSTQLTNLSNQNPAPTVDVTGNFETANTTISNLVDHINNLQSKTIDITINRHNNGGGSGDGTHSLSGQNNKGIALLGGSAKDDLSKHAGETLVGEEGEELHVSREGGYYQLVGENGPEFRNDIMPQDIVFDHEQTIKLLKNGHTNKRGKALLGGSQKFTGPAYVTKKNSMNGGVDFNHSDPKKVQGKSGSDTTTPKDTKATEQHTTATQAATKSLDNFKKKFEGLTDWIEVLRNRLSNKIDQLTKKADYETTYGAKNAKLDSAMDTTRELIKVDSKEAKQAQKRYKKELKSVKSSALYNNILKDDAKKAGMTEGKFANDIIKKIKNGTIDIKKYSEGTQAFISEYQNWYEKLKDCNNEIIDLKQSLKDLQQQKLDNIVDQFESLQSYAESVSKVSQSMISLNNTAGKTSYSSTNKEEFRKQIGQQNLITKYIEQERDAYKNEMDKAAKIFGTDSNEYRAAQTAYEGMNAALYESKENAIALKRELLDLNTKPFDYSIERLKEWATDLQGIVSLKQARGTMKGDSSTMINEWDYSDQIRAANNQIAKLSGRIATNWAIIDEMGYEIDSDEYRELEAAIRADEQAINDLKISNEQLKDSIVELRWKPFEDLQKKTKEAISDFDHLRGLLNSEGFFDQNGEGWNLTEEGYANLALLGAQIQKTNTQIADYRKALDKVNEEYNNGNISLEEYEEKSRNMVDIIQDLVDSNENYKDSIVELYKTQITNETNALQELIDKRQESLSAKKQYYDYDKSLRSNQGELTRLRAQAQALQGVTNAASQARLARINEEIAQKQKDLDDQVMEHRYDVQSEGYSKLSKDAQENLSDTLAMVASNSALQEAIVTEMLGLLTEKYGLAYDEIQDKIASTGTKVSQTADECLKSPQLASFFNDQKLKADDIKNAWGHYLDGLQDASGVALDPGSKLSEFLGRLKTETENAYTNWDAFTTSIANGINIEKIKTNLTSLGEELDKVIKKEEEVGAKSVKETANPPKTDTGSGGGNASKATTGEDKKTGSTNGLVSNVTGGNATKAATSGMSKKTASVSTNASAVADAIKKDEVKKFISDLPKPTTEQKNKMSSYSELVRHVYEKDKKFLSEKNQLKLAGILGFKDIAAKTTKTITKADKNKIKKKLEDYGYASGTLGTKTNELNWTHQGEIIRRSDGAILRQLPAGTQVVPKIESENLFKWAQINPLKMFADLDTPSVVQNQTSQAITLNVESIFHIDGNVDADVMDRLEELGKALAGNRNFQKNITNIVTKEYVREGRKLGYK